MDYCVLTMLLLCARFHYMAVADNRQRFMPLPDDRLPPRGQQLAYPEAVLLVDPIEPEFKGEVFTEIEHIVSIKKINWSVYSIN